MKKFDWGYGIATFYILFALVLMGALYASTKVDHSLVKDDYYQLDLEYQDHYDKVERSNSSQLLSIDYKEKDHKVIFRFRSTESPQGTITFYRAADSSLDFKMPINSNQMRIDTEKLVEGNWKVNVDWNADGKTYYQEEDIHI